MVLNLSNSSNLEQLALKALMGTDNIFLSISYTGLDISAFYRG